MIDVICDHDGARFCSPATPIQKPELQLVIDRLKLRLPPQPAARITPPPPSIRPAAVVKTF